MDCLVEDKYGEKKSDNNLMYFFFWRAWFRSTEAVRQKPLLQVSYNNVQSLSLRLVFGNPQSFLHVYFDWMTRSAPRVGRHSESVSLMMI